MSGDERPFASPGQIVGYDRKTYVVTAYRWGDTERHSYVVDVAPSLEAAKASAAEEEERRGGKYSCGIVEMAAKGAWRTVVEPEQNPDICRPGAARRDDLGEALLWHWAGSHRLARLARLGPWHVMGRQERIEFNQVMAMRVAAAARIAELLEVADG